MKTVFNIIQAIYVKAGDTICETGTNRFLTVESVRGSAGAVVITYTMPRHNGEYSAYYYPTSQLIIAREISDE